VSSNLFENSSNSIPRPPWSWRAFLPSTRHGHRSYHGTAVFQTLPTCSTTKNHLLPSQWPPELAPPWNRLHSGANSRDRRSTYCPLERSSFSAPISSFIIPRHWPLPRGKGKEQRRLHGNRGESEEIRNAIAEILDRLAAKSWLDPIVLDAYGPNSKYGNVHGPIPHANPGWEPPQGGNEAEVIDTTSPNPLNQCGMLELLV
jgi:hypothetical protein